MTTLFSALLLLTSLFNGAATQTPHASASNETEVEELVTTFFDAMRDSDSDVMSSFLMPGATLHTVASSEEGERILRETDIDAFLNSVGTSEPGSLDEQLTSFIAHIDGDLATAWMGYDFFYNGEFSHCGVNTMNLLKAESGWKIFSIVDTRRREGCDD